MSELLENIKRGETLILRRNLSLCGIANPDSYEWLDGEAWYLGEAIQARVTENEQRAISQTLKDIGSFNETDQNPNSTRI